MTMTMSPLATAELAAPMVERMAVPMVELTVEQVTALVTEQERMPVMAQRFLPAVTEGDKRILLVDGEPLGAINRRPSDGEFRSNLAVGGQAEATELSAREHQICDALAPALRAEGLFFVGIDVIDGMLSEINVTSPTGIREVERLMQQPLADQVMERLQALI